MRRVVLLLCLVFVPATVLAQPRAPLAPVVVQGAMASETDALIGLLESPTREQIGGWTFWRGTVDGYPVIVSRTNKGVSKRPPRRPSRSSASVRWR